MTRAITSNNYTETCADLICTFAAAIEADRMDRNDMDVASTAAFELAASCGWNWEADQDFTHWALKATAEESLVEGLQKALVAVRAQYDAFLAQAPWRGDVSP